MLNQELANRFREVMLNGKWIANTNYKHELQNLSWLIANQNIGTLNSIALLTFHINYYIKGLIPVFDAGGLEIKDQYSFEMLPISSEQDWNNLVNELLINAETLTLKIEQLEEQKLYHIFVDEKYGTYLRNIEGLIEHCYYHLGQIVIIKKMIIE